MDFLEHPFWDFSLEIYGLEGVAQACLVLQDECGVDINLLLFCCWAGATSAGSLGEQNIRNAINAAESWQSEIISPLRTLRWRLKQGFANVSQATAESLRQALQRTEIDAEHVEQLLLAETISATPGTDLSTKERATDAADNLATYLAVLGVRQSQYIRQHLAVLLAACFSELEGTELDDILS